jgi:hypothetical protein
MPFRHLPYSPRKNQTYTPTKHLANLGPYTLTERQNNTADEPDEEREPHENKGDTHSFQKIPC